MLVEFNRAIEILSPYTTVLSDAMHQGFNRFLKLPPQDRLDMRATSQAGVIHDFQVKEIDRIAETHKELRSHKIGELFLLVIEEKFAVRIKKLGQDRKPKNQPTQQVKDFQNQNFDLPGIPSIISLELGYTLNVLGRIEDVLIVCPNGKYSNHWEWGIDSEIEIGIEFLPADEEQARPEERYTGEKETYEQDELNEEKGED